MLSGPAILRISVLLLIAGVLAALVQFLLPTDTPKTAPRAPVVARRAEPISPVQAPTSIPAPAPAPAPARVAEPPASPAAMPTDALAFPPATPAPGTSASAKSVPSKSSPAASPPITAAPVPAAPPSPQPRGDAEIAEAERETGPRGLALIDLNTASVGDLNRLQGGGTIGRAIISKRPYASVDQLMSKRVLSRAVYDRIKEQVTVR